MDTIKVIADYAEPSDVNLQTLRIGYIKLDGGSCECSCETIEPDCFDRLCFVTGGTASAELCDKRYDGLMRDSVLYIPKNREVKIDIDGSDFEAYVVFIDVKNSPSFFRKLGFSETNAVRVIAGKMAQVVEMYKFANEQTAASSYLCAGIFFELLSYFAVRKEKKEQPVLSENEYVTKAKEYIHMQYHLNITIKMVADEVYLNRSYFSTMFKRITGKSPMDYLIEFRIKQACKLLDMGKSITDTAMLTGFGSASGFAAHFKRIMKITPSEYKNGSSFGGKNEKNN